MDSVEHELLGERRPFAISHVGRRETNATVAGTILSASASQDARLCKYPRSAGKGESYLAAMSLTYSAERQVAIAAVRRACVLTDSVFNKLVRNETLTKDDKSPVTGKSPLGLCATYILETWSYSGDSHSRNYNSSTFAGNRRSTLSFCCTE